MIKRIRAAMSHVAMGAILASAAAAPVQADVIKTFDVSVLFPSGTRYPIDISGTVTLNTTSEQFVSINLGFEFFFNGYGPYTAFSAADTATYIGITSTIDSSPLNPLPFTIGLALARSTFGSDPSSYNGGPIDPDGTFFSNSGTGPSPGNPASGSLTFVPGSTIVTPPTGVPEPATPLLLGTGLAAALLAAVPFRPARRRSVRMGSAAAPTVS